MSDQARRSGRKPDELRPIRIERHFTHSAAGSVLIAAGNTLVLATASIETQVPAWMAGRGKGWVTAEYSMLPGSTSPRKPRERGGKSDSRSLEIQRLIGRSLRAVVDLAALGERTVTVDCDVLQADGGTRTLSVTGAYIALVEALRSLPDWASSGGRPLPLTDSVAAVSVGIVDGCPQLDLDYAEDVSAAVDMNVVMTGRGQFVEIQGTGEKATFNQVELAAMVALAERGIAQLSSLQRESLGADWPF